MGLCYTMTEKLILNYSHFIEVVDEEECACFRRWPTGIVDYANMLEVPQNGAIRFLSGDLGSQIVEYERERLELFESFGGDGYSKECPYCKSGMRIVHKDDRKHNDVFGKIFVSKCIECGWWESSDECQIEYGEDNWYKAREIRRRALLKEYSVGGCELPLDTLRQYIEKKPAILREIHPGKLEELVGSVFSEHMECEAIHIGGPNDGGIDLILINSDNQYVIQVKRRESPNRAESVSGIREFLGAMLLRGDMKGVFVSTAPKFSSHAISAASKAKEKKLVEFINLIDSTKLIDVCKLTSKNIKEPWANFAAKAGDPSLEFPERNTYFAFQVRK